MLYRDTDRTTAAQFQGRVSLTNNTVIVGLGNFWKKVIVIVVDGKPGFGLFGLRYLEVCHWRYAGVKIL